MTDTATSHLRLLMSQLANTRAEHNRQRSSPSRGYNEDNALAFMAALAERIEIELDRIDESMVNYEKELAARAGREQ